MPEYIDKQDAIDLVRDVCDAVMSKCDCHYDEDLEDYVFDNISEVDAILKCNKEIRIALRNMQRHNTTLSDVLAYIENINEEDWQELVCCLDQRGFTLKSHVHNWCGQRGFA